MHVRLDACIHVCMHAHLHAHAHAGMHGLVHACITRQQYSSAILAHICLVPNCGMRPPIYIDVLAVSGKVLLQSFPVDDAIVGKDLINLVKKHLGKHDEICKLLHKHDPIKPLVGLADQNITECSQLTAVFWL